MKLSLWGRQVALRNCLKASMFAVTALLTLSVSATGEEQMVLGPRQLERDTTTKGAVLCDWSFLIEIQTATAACGLARRPIDDAIDEAIATIDEFILANSSLHPTRTMLDEFKRRKVEAILTRLKTQDLQKSCNQESKLEYVRRSSPDKIRAQVKDLLDPPREPVMNSCS